MHEPSPPICDHGIAWPDFAGAAEIDLSLTSWDAVVVAACKRAVVAIANSNAMDSFLTNIARWLRESLGLVPDPVCGWFEGESALDHRGEVVRARVAIHEQGRRHEFLRVASELALLNRGLAAGIMPMVKALPRGASRGLAHHNETNRFGYPAFLLGAQIVDWIDWGVSRIGGDNAVKEITAPDSIPGCRYVRGIPA